MMTGFLIAVGAVSAVCFVLMTRAENVRLNRARSRDSSYDGGSVSSDSDSWGYSSGSESSTNATGGACASGSWDSGGGDCGGGGGDSGGGGSGGD
jgi:hypothetical protein